MFKQVFLLSLTSGILSTIVCIVYSQMYFSKLVDFSESISIIKLLTNCLLVAMTVFFVYIGLTKLIKKIFLAEFVFNLLLTLTSIASVFYVLKSDDPMFKNEDAALMIDYYKGFVIPMLFFPSLMWFTLKPLFIRKL